MLLALIIVLGLLALMFAALYRRAFRERMAITEYTQFLLLHAESYEDHHRKFLAYLAGTGNMTAMERGRDAQRVVERMANSGFDKVLLGNIAARNRVVADASKSATK
ncbi:MAG: hypothetical protein WB439_06810 [Acidobacteriaceae bacterium]